MIQKSILIDMKNNYKNAILLIKETLNLFAANYGSLLLEYTFASSADFLNKNWDS
jgi:hypothetical protein